MFEIVVRRLGGADGSTSVGVANTNDLATALDLRNRKAAELIGRGFKGRRNAAGVWRLSKRDFGKRVRLAVYVRQIVRPVRYLN
jgi:hypothetical protein